jgi:hypothetical protein
MGKLIRGLGKIVGPLEGVLSMGLDERDKRKAAEQALSEVTQAAQVPAPVEEPIATMPLPMDATAQTARKKSVSRQRQRRGRNSTILTALNDESEGRLGG